MFTSPVLVASLAAALAATLARRVTTVPAAPGTTPAGRRRAPDGPDALTGLANRCTFTTGLAAAVGDRRAVPVVLVDVHRLKHVNDQHGHGTGDAGWSRSPAGWPSLGHRWCRRPGCPGTSSRLLIHAELDQAYTAACRTRHAIADRPIAAGRRVLPVRAGIGVASARPGISFGQLPRRPGHVPGRSHRPRGVRPHRRLA